MPISIRNQMPNPPLVFDQNLGSASGKNKDFTFRRDPPVATAGVAQALEMPTGAAFRRN